jgi:TonB family protein
VPQPSLDPSYELEVRSRVLSAVAGAWDATDASKRSGLSGRVILKLLVDAEGKPQRTEILQSSGFAQLDLMATRAARGSGPFPQPGPKLKKLGTFTVLVPIEFGHSPQLSSQ